MMKFNLKHRVSVNLLFVLSIAASQFSLAEVIWQDLFVRQPVTRALTLSENGKTVWVGTQNGLGQRDAVTGQWLRVLVTLGNLDVNSVHTLTDDGRGGVWVAVYDDWRGYGSSLAHLDHDGKWTVFDFHNSFLPGDNVTALVRDKKGLWIGTTTGLAYLDDQGVWNDIPYPELSRGSISALSAEEDSFDSLLSDGKGGIWMGTYGGLED